MPSGPASISTIPFGRFYIIASQALRKSSLENILWNVSGISASFVIDPIMHRFECLVFSVVSRYIIECILFSQDNHFFGQMAEFLGNEKVILYVREMHEWRCFYEKRFEER